ncbi:MAG: rhodanese-like domain-containing protein [Candidatus Aminicenantales bacterium]
MREWKRLGLELLLVGLAACVLGGAFHFSLLRRFLSGEFRQSFLDERKYPGLHFIAGGEAQDLWGSGRALFIDSRTHRDYAAGHVPGALSIPLDELKMGSSRRVEETEGRSLHQFLLSYPPDTILVVYCEGGDCQTSIALARLIHGLGFKDIRVFDGGWAEWSALGLPVEESR